MAIQFANKSSVAPHYNPLRKRKNDRKREGTVQFNRDQTYEGEFLRDSLHGEGTYNWVNAALYDGGFYSNCKEGYASISFPDNSYFEGLFVGNQPFGPGIFTHPNGRQDAGFWKGRKLVRLSRVVDFIIPRLAPTSAAKIKLLQFRRLIPVEEDNPSVTCILEKYGHSDNISAPFSTEIYDKRSIFFDKLAFEKAYFTSPKQGTKLPNGSSLNGQLYDEDEEEEEDGEEEDEDTLEEEPKRSPPPHCVCPTDVFVMNYEKEASVDVCEREGTPGEDELGILGFFSKYGTEEKINSALEEDIAWYARYAEEVMGEEETNADFAKVPKIVSWNRNELCTEMLKQIFRFRDFEGKLNFNLSKLMVGARTAFRKTGENEMQCLQFLKMCSLGPAHVIRGLLCAFQISEELMDGRGNNSLMFAAATDRRDVIDVLLNHGVDLNSFNDEGLTPLNLCLLRRLAYAHGISNWETAFLPKEIDETQYDDAEAHGYPTTESITSLDRIFGDGMSLEEGSVFALGSATLSPPGSPPVERKLSEKKHSDSKREMSKTLLNVPAGPVQGSLSVINWEWDFRAWKSLSLVALSNPTPTLNIKIIPKSVRGDEFQRSLGKSNKDKYLFEISFETKSETEEAHDLKKKKRMNKEEVFESDDELSDNSLTVDLDTGERIAEIDKTILLLLNRGADPNLSEVPKPSLHLALYTKDIKTIHNLLMHGANPDIVLHENEGCLTPLHVIALQKPTLENVHICELLLSFKANPDKETLPGYSITEEEIEYMDFNQGRTPLHLLCMRPDLEYADPYGYLIRMAIILAKAGQKKHLYNGHSYLTLAMLFGNMKLLRALLFSQVFDPKEVLGNNRGTCLHVLLSGELQKRTCYDTSIQMCDLLIGAGADPLKTFKNPRNLLGTCVDYGYRELGLLREARYSEEFRGVNTFLSKRDFLKEHEKVLEYVADIVSATAKLRRKHFLEVGRFQRYKPSTDRWRRRGSRRTRTSGMENTSSGTFTESDDKMKGSKDRYASLEERVSKLILGSRRVQSDKKREGQHKVEASETKEVEGKKKKRQAEYKKEKTEVEDRKETKESQVHHKKEKTEVEDIKERKEMRDKKDKKGAKETHNKKEGKEAQDQKEETEVEDREDEEDREDKKGKKGKNGKRVDAEESEKPSKKKKEEEDDKPHKNGDHKNKGRMRKGSDEDIEEQKAATRAPKAAAAKSAKAGAAEAAAKSAKTGAGDASAAAGGRPKAKIEKDEGKLPHEKEKKPRKESVEAQQEDSETRARKRKKEHTVAPVFVEEGKPIKNWKGILKGKFNRRGTAEGSDTDTSAVKHGKKKKDSTDDEGLDKRKQSKIKEDSKELRRGSKRRETGTSESARDGRAKKVYSGEAKEGNKSQGATRTSVPSRSTRGRASNVTGAELSSLRTVSERRSGGPEVFPENLRKVLLRMYGNCAKMDVNEFLMPYVVLRDGQLYYKFKGKATKQKEQYSLI